MSINLVSMSNWSVNVADVTVNLSHVRCHSDQNFQGGNSLIFRRYFFLPNDSFFLPQIYKIGTLILQYLIYTLTSPKFLLIISGNVLPQFKKLQTLIFFLLNPKTRIPNFFLWNWCWSWKKYKIDGEGSVHG